MSLDLRLFVCSSGTIPSARVSPTKPGPNGVVERLGRLGLLPILHTSCVGLALELFFSFVPEVLPLMIGSSRPFTMTMSSSSMGYGSGTAVEGTSAGLRSTRGDTEKKKRWVLPLVLPF